MKNKKEKKVPVEIIISTIGLLGTIIAAVIGSIGFLPEIGLLLSPPTPTAPISPNLTSSLSLEPNSIIFSVFVAPEEFLQNDSTAVQNFLDQAEKPFRQFKPHIGFVLTIGYGNTSVEGQMIAEIANRNLAKSNPDIFSKSIMKSFSSIADENNPPGTIEFEVYFFANQVP